MMPLPRRAAAVFACLVFSLSSALLAAAPAPARAAGKSKPPAARAVTADDLKGLSWRCVGPANMGGRVSAIALAPGGGATFYVGYGTGGLWKTENLGTTFTPVFDKTGQHSIGAVAVADAPADWPGWEPENTPPAERARRGAARIVWVGTGEGNGRNSSSWGGGVYRSTDAGATFAGMGLKESHDIPSLAIDPRDPDVVYVAALGRLWGANPERGVYKTADGGKTWRHALRIDADTGACDVAIDPGQPDRVYAAMYARRRTPWNFTGGSERGGIFRSEDGGTTWRKLTAGLPARTGRIGLAVFAGDPRIVYAVVESDVGGTGRDEFDDRSPSGGVFRSEDHGESWTRVSDINPRPFYFSRLAVDPENGQRVYLLGWDLLVSDDGGRSFRRSSEHVHVDLHAIAIDPRDPARILIGTDGGAYISHDRARSWLLLDNLAVGQFYRVAVDLGDPYRIGGGLQDNGSWIGPSATLTVTDDEAKDGILNCDWRMIHGWDGFGVAFDPLDPNLVYATGQGGFLTRIRLDNAVMNRLRPSPREGQERLRFNWDAPFFVSPHDPAVLYHAGNKVFRLTERGDKWFAVSGDLSRREADKIMTAGSEAETHGTVVSLAESPLRAGLLWAGTDDGLIHVTEDGGGAWRQVTPKAGGSLYVACLTPSAHDARTAYAALDGHRSDVLRPLILMTADLGRSWLDITGDLPADQPALVVQEDPSSRDVLYCGTQFGAYVTFDRGARWLRLNGASLPPAPVADLVIHPRERDLVAGTHGRSVWVLDDISMFGQLDAATRERPLALLAPRPARPRLHRGAHYGRGHGIFRAKNPPPGAYLNYWVRENPEPVSMAIADSAGFVLRTLEGHARAGLNRIVWDLKPDAKHSLGVSRNDIPGPEQFVPPGRYKATLTMGEARDEAFIEVLPFLAR